MNPGIFGLVSTVVDKLFSSPAERAEAKLKLIELEQAGELAELNADLQLALGQMAINQVEAASTNWFVAGWRPAVGWACVLGLTMEFLISPLCTWIAALAGSKVVFPDMDIGTLLTLLFAMLGIGGMRTAEKIKGAEGNR